MGEVLVIPSPLRAGGYVELASGPADSSGRQPARFRKHILNLGTLKYQGREFNLDENWYARLKDNFNSGVSMVQVPLANDDNKHTENPLANTGEVIGVEREGNKVYTVIEVRKPKVAEGIRDKTILGASAFLAMDYTDTRTQKKVGPALLHHCLTNRPYVLDLDPYEEIVAATADMEWDDPIVLASQEGSMDKNDLLAALKAEHGIDVEALQAAAAQRTDTAALTAAVAEALKGSQVQLSADGGNITLSDITGAIVELSTANKAQAKDIADLKLSAAEAEVEGYIGVGRLLPKTREVAIEMALSNRPGLDAILAPADKPYVALSSPVGRNAPDGEEKHNQDIDGELARLTAEHPEMFKGAK